MVRRDAKLLGVCLARHDGRSSGHYLLGVSYQSYREIMSWTENIP